MIEDDAYYRELSLEERPQVRLGLSKQVRNGKHFWIFIHQPYPHHTCDPFFGMRAKLYLPQRIGYGAFMDVKQWPAFSPNVDDRPPHTHSTRYRKLTA
jgi:hypothetical protein